MRIRTLITSSTGGTCSRASPLAATPHARNDDEERDERGARGRDAPRHERERVLPGEGDEQAQEKEDARVDPQALAHAASRRVVRPAALHQTLPTSSFGASERSFPISLVLP